MSAPKSNGTMSLNSKELKNAIEALLVYANVTKKRKFLETVELEIGLKNYDPIRSKKFNKSAILPHFARYVCC